MGFSVNKMRIYNNMLGSFLEETSGLSGSSFSRPGQVESSAFSWQPVGSLDVHHCDPSSRGDGLEGGLFQRHDQVKCPSPLAYLLLFQVFFKIISLFLFFTDRWWRSLEVWDLRSAASGALASWVRTLHQSEWIEYCKSLRNPFPVSEKESDDDPAGS